MQPLISLVLAAGTLNPIPPVSTPCRTVSTPNGQMCVTQSILKIYGEVIRTQRESDAKFICHGRGGNELVPTSNQREWICIRRVSVG